MGNLSAAVMAGADLRYQQQNWTLWLRLLAATENQRYGDESPGRSVIITSGVKQCSGAGSVPRSQSAVT
jgi:hypothetical protein